MSTYGFRIVGDDVEPMKKKASSNLMTFKCPLLMIDFVFIHLYHFN